ncbi:hypothetical protein EYF80_021829 [Liparis tanakae]|uniref:Uncharacterized protein n=1 Tax=Liparis tanakae TaxID=230148 RepID=A0A4Z2HQF1_9TELE|nr:hypothetical protein EYF80_021829 [Liparis tanakae]
MPLGDKREVQIGEERLFTGGERIATRTDSTCLCLLAKNLGKQAAPGCPEKLCRASILSSLHTSNPRVSNLKDE